MIVLDQECVCAVFVKAEFGSNDFTECGEATGHEDRVAAIGFHGSDEFAASGCVGDALGEDLTDDRLWQPFKKADTFEQSALEIQFAIHRTSGDVRHAGANARHVGKLVDAFLTDHRGIHVGNEHFLAPSLRLLDDEVDTDALEVFPNLPAVLGSALYGELCSDAGIQPLRLAAAPGVTEGFYCNTVQIGAGGGSEQCDDVHARFPIVDAERRFSWFKRRFSPLFRLVPDLRPFYLQRWDTPPQRGALIWKDTMTDLTIPAARPANPRFSSGPCAKIPGYSLDMLADAPLGRSHRAAVGKAKLKEAIDLTRDVLGVPADYRIGIVPASDTGAVEMALWSLLGERPVEMLAWESFGEGWVTDVIKQLKLDATVRKAPYGEIVDFGEVDFDKDVVFTWNGTTSGVRVPNGDPIPEERAGLTICDATSAAFAMDLPFDKLDVVTFSWQKVLGGEAAHGMLILSPRAVERLESYTPAWPLPKVFRLTKGGKLIEGIFEGATINTPSMLAVEDYLVALKWAQQIGGRKALIARAEANAKAIADFIADKDWIANLAVDPATASTTSVCLKFTDDRIKDGAAFAKAVAKRLEKEGVALDAGAYRDAPPGLRIWCGSTVEASDVKALMPWVEWAFNAEIEAQSVAA